MEMTQIIGYSHKTKDGLTIIVSVNCNYRIIIEGQI